MSEAWRTGLGLAALALAMAWLYGTIDYLGEFASVDLRHYRTMAHAAPGIAEARSPFAHRLLGPYLAGLLPLPDPLAFRLLTNAALVAVTLGLWRFQLRLGLEASVAAFTAALVPLNPYVFGFPAFNPFQLGDVLVMGLLLVAFGALLERRWGLYALALAVGAATREPAVLAVPAALVFLWERGASADEYRRWLLASLPAAAVFVGLRLLVPAEGAGLFVLLVDHVGKAATLDTWYRLLVNAWAPLSLLPFVFWSTTRTLVSRHRWLLTFAVLVLASALFGGDQERLVAPAFLAVYPLVGGILQARMWDKKACVIIGAAAFVTSLHHLTARFPLPERTWTVVLSLAALAAVTGLALVYRASPRSLSGHRV